MGILRDFVAHRLYECTLFLLSERVPLEAIKSGEKVSSSFFHSPSIKGNGETTFYAEKCFMSIDLFEIGCFL